MGERGREARVPQPGPPAIIIGCVEAQPSSSFSLYPRVRRAPSFEPLEELEMKAPGVLNFLVDPCKV